jgi:hypothetical protein
MDPVWTRLPNDLVLKIIGLLDDIDTRRAFRLPPRKLSIDQSFQFRNEIVYDPVTKILRQIELLDDEILTFWYRGIELSVIRPGPLYVFNMEWNPYEITMLSNDYVMGPNKCNTHVVVRNKKVKILLRYGPRDMAEVTN